MFPESQFTRPTELCPYPQHWNAHDEQATEDEVSEMIGALVRALQPDVVLETGAYKGYTSERIARALHENGHGVLYAVEKDGGLAGDTRSRVKPFVRHVEVYTAPSLAVTFRPDTKIDLAFFDSGGGALRAEEFRHFARWMHRRTIVLFHDVAPHHAEIHQAVLQLADEERIFPVFLPTPRGLAICEFLK